MNTQETMKDMRAALKMAIEAMEEMQAWTGKKDIVDKTIQACKEAIASNSEALAQPSQEPVDVARVQADGYSVEWRPDMPHLPIGTKLYTHPAPSWQGLSDNEINFYCGMKGNNHIDFARAIEQALKEKNT